MGSNPSMVTVNPVLLVVPATLVMEGAAGPMTIVFVGGGVGVIFCPDATSCEVTVIVPATVPVCTPTLVVEVVAPALTVSVAVRPPVEN